MKQVYIDVPNLKRLPDGVKFVRFLIGMILTPFYFFLANRLHTPGLGFRRECAKLGLRLLFKRKVSSLSYGSIYNLIFFPMDSTRYFESEFVWEALATCAGGTYLDVSSPRLIPLLFCHKHPGLEAVLINPDRNDFNVTGRLMDALGLKNNLKLRRWLIGEVPYPKASFDVITCVSVLEHIPEAKAATRKMWDLLRPGGKLLLTLPCLAEAAEQYISKNEYGLLPSGQDGYTFWQLYYDAHLLEERIFRILGNPVRMAVYGERVAGSFARNAQLMRATGVGYPFWREPYLVGREYTYFQSIADLPGEGVVAMEFVK